ncbi:MAG: hypothetical protein ACQEUK_03170 [Pseudomonadota bacterium]
MAAERRPEAPLPTPAPLRAAFAGALTLTPHYNTCVHNTLVARGNADREERAQAAPANGGGTTPRGTAPNPSSAARCLCGCADAYAALQHLYAQYIT